MYAPRKIGCFTDSPLQRGGANLEWEKIGIRDGVKEVLLDGDVDRSVE